MSKDNLRAALCAIGATDTTQPPYAPHRHWAMNPPVFTIGGKWMVESLLERDGDITILCLKKPGVGVSLSTTSSGVRTVIRFPDQGQNYVKSTITSVEMSEAGVTKVSVFPSKESEIEQKTRDFTKGRFKDWNPSTRKKSLFSKELDCFLGLALTEARDLAKDAATPSFPWEFAPNFKKAVCDLASFGEKYAEKFLNVAVGQHEFLPDSIAVGGNVAPGEVASLR